MLKIGQFTTGKLQLQGADTLFWPLRVPWRCGAAFPRLRAPAAGQRGPAGARVWSWRGPAAQRRAMAAARAEKRGAGRARRGPELRPALLEPAREQAEGGGGGRPGARRGTGSRQRAAGLLGWRNLLFLPGSPRYFSLVLSRSLSHFLAGNSH